VSCVLVVDAGSTTVNAAVVVDGEVVARARRTCPLVVPEDAPTGREWDPLQLWAVTSEAIRAATESVSPDAVVCTTQRLGAVFCDAKGDALYAGPNLDARGIVEAVHLQAELGARIYDVAGHQPPIVLVAARLAWFRANRPEVAAGTRTVMPLSDWLAYRLCGEIGAEPTNASDTGLLDVRNRTWAADLAAECGVDPALLAPLREPGTELGSVTSAAAADTDLRPGTPVAVGMGDTMAALCGMGVVDAGAAAVVAGSTMPVAVVCDSAPTDPYRRLWVGCHGPRGRWMLEANGSECGIAQAWLADLMATEPEQLHVMALEAGPGAVAPAVLGPGPLDFSDLPVIHPGELHVNLPLAQVGPGRNDIARAFVESVGYGARHCLTWIEAAAPVTSVALGGGMAQSPLLPQVVASMLAAPIEVFDVDVTVRGAACSAEVALGGHADLVAAARAQAGRGRTVEPVEEWVATYEAGYQVWVETWDRLIAGVPRFSTMISSMIPAAEAPEVP